MRPGRSSEKNCEDIKGLETIKLMGGKKVKRTGIIYPEGQKVKEQNHKNPQRHASGVREHS
jgi:hypothetical protein